MLHSAANRLLGQTQTEGAESLPRLGVAPLVTIPAAHIAEKGPEHQEAGSHRRMKAPAPARPPPAVSERWQPGLHPAPCLLARRTCLLPARSVGDPVPWLPESHECVSELHVPVTAAGPGRNH